MTGGRTLPAASRLGDRPVRTSVAARPEVPTRRRSFGGVLLFALCGWAAITLATARPAQAAPYAVNLEYRAGAGCPAAPEFAATVQSRLGYDPFSEGADEKVLVLITSRGDALNGRVEWRDRHGEWAGEQAFPGSGTDCRRLAHAMGFALAVQIQILAATRLELDDGALPLPTPPAREPAPVAPPPPSPVAPAPAPPVTIQAPPAVPPATFSAGPALAIGAGAAAAVGMSSNPTWSGRVFGALAWPHVSVELGAALSAPDITRRADGAGYSQRFVFLAAAGCATLVRLSACLLSNVGQVRMHGEDIDRPTSANVPLVELGVRAGARQRMGRHLFWQAHLDGLANLNRWTATLDRVPVWTAPRFVASLGVEAGVWIP